MMEEKFRRLRISGGLSGSADGIILHRKRVNAQRTDTAQFQSFRCSMARRRRAKMPREVKFMSAATCSHFRQSR